MKKKFRFLLLPGMVALSFLYYAFWTPPIFTLSEIPANGAIPKHLKVNVASGLPQLTQKAGADAPYWKVFFSLGDGRFWMGRLDELPNQKFFYNTTFKAPANAFIEYTAAYDDTVNPERCANVPVNHTNTTSIPVGEELAINMGVNDVAKLQCNREICSGDKLTFMLTRQLPGLFSDPDVDYTRAKIEFTYDPNVLIYQNCDDFDYRDPSNPIQTSSNKITVYLKQLPIGRAKPYNQQTIFLNFTAKTGLVAGGAYQTPALHIFSPGVRNDLYTHAVGESTMPTQAIESGHDPNHKSGVELLGLTDQYAYFKIDFQNEGAGPTNEIEIEDKLDFLCDPISEPPSIDQCDKCYGGIPSATVVSLSKRNYKFTLTGHYPILNGLREPGLGSRFTEEDTKGSITIKVKIENIYSWRSSALLNQARVRFGCNPLFNTNIASSVIPCSDTINILADTIFTVPNVAGITTVINGLPTLLNNYGINQLNGKFRWYPCTEVTNPVIMQPSFLPDANGTYTLVASKCNPNTNVESKNDIVYVHITIPTPLNITVDKCENPGYLVATVTGYTGSNPNADLKWDDCNTKGIRKTIPIDPNKSVYYFGVVDLSTGNDKEIFYKIPRGLCRNIFDTWFNKNRSIFLFFTVLAGVTFLLYYLRKIKRNKL
jgi:hypothetical protein